MQRRRRRWLLTNHMQALVLLLLLLQSSAQVGDGGGGGGGGGGGDDVGLDDGIIVTEANLGALLAMKHALEDPEGALSSWNESGVGACSGTWEGIKCAKGQVIVIQLPSKGLGGVISERVGELSELRKLNLHNNHIGGMIPESLGTLQSLRSVYLFRNNLSGSIPVGLGSSPEMRAVDLSFNQLHGPLPTTLAASSKLTILNFSHNNLTGSFPSDWASTASSLVVLAAAGNRLTGELPDSWGGLATSASLAADVASTSDFQVRFLDLSDNEFTGRVPLSLGRLALLQELHLERNMLDGNIPASLFTRLKMLIVVDMSHNKINGSIPDSISNATNLTAVDLSSNLIGGNIPESIGNLSNLVTLDLSQNSLNGSIPESFVTLSKLIRFNVSHNRLSGRIPNLQSPFNSSSFAGNADLCGSDGFPSCSPSTAPSTTSPSPSQSHNNNNSNSNSKSSKGKGKLSKVSLICIVLGSALAFGAVICMVLLLVWRLNEHKAIGREGRKGKEKNGGGVGGGAAGSSPSEGSGGGGGGAGKLVHFDGPFTFTADDLLCATAEVMGKSTYGTVYKATLENGNTVVVKRLREGIVKGQKEFESEVGVLGRIRHPNLVALRAYYWGPKDEKLLVFDFMPGGSLSAYLHARGPETPLGWNRRMKIALGAVRGIEHLHEKEKMTHGNLTSTNILLDSNLNAVVSDYGLSRLMNATTSGAAAVATAGYRAPEMTSKGKKATCKSDVYSIGIVLLELLTGKAAGESVSSGDGFDLPEWVSSVVKEEWTSEVFDVELLKGVAPSEDEMLNTLQLAMKCVSVSPSSRPEIHQVLKQLEDVCAASSSPPPPPPPPPPPSGGATTSTGGASSSSSSSSAKVVL